MTRPSVQACSLRSLRSTALVLLVLAGCSSSDADKPTTVTGNEKRNTEITHEACDGTAASASRVDVNGDGKPDIIHVRAGGREVCRIVDLNLDGAVDAFIYYDAQGKERRREADFDRDGRADEIAHYTAGVIALKERETNFDNKIDTWDHYEGGRLVRRERDSDGDGIVDQWWQYNDPTRPRCAIVSSDQNADGKPDPDAVVDLCGESYGVSKYTPPGAPGASAPDAGAPDSGAQGAAAPNAPPKPTE